MSKSFLCLFCCFLSCFASVYASPPEILISFEERGTAVRGRMNHIIYKFRLIRKVSKDSGFFIVEIEQSLLKALYEQKLIDFRPNLDQYDAWLQGGLGGDRVFKLYVTYIETKKTRGKKEKVIPTRKIEDMVRHITEESWKDNKYARGRMERAIRKAEKIYIEHVNLTDAVEGRLMEFPRETILYRSGLYQGYPKFTYNIKVVRLGGKKANGTE